MKRRTAVVANKTFARVRGNIGMFEEKKLLTYFIYGSTGSVMWRPCPELSAEEEARKWRPVARGAAGTRPGSQLMEAALGLHGRCVTWHHPRWGEEPPGLRLAETGRERGTLVHTSNREAKKIIK